MKSRTIERTRNFVLLVIFAAAALPVCPAAEAQPARPFTLAAAVGIPGGGGVGGPPCGTNPAYLNPVLLFHFVATKPASPSATIPPCPATSVNDPIYVAFDNRGELFVANRHGNQAVGVGSISRFVFDPNGTPIGNGVITDPGLSAPHGLAFSPNGELFAGNYLTGTISRFRFRPQGNAIPNGTINTGLGGLLGLAFNRQGELFLTAGGSTIYRYVFDPASGAAIPNGSIAVPAAGGLHALAFSHRGELFASDIYTDTVFRFRFDSDGSALPNGSFIVPGGPIGLAFSPPGELFVSSHFSGGISRFVFDAEGNPVPNGFTSTPQMGGVAIFPSAR